MAGYYNFSGTSCTDGLDYELWTFYPPGVTISIGSVLSGDTTLDYYTVISTPVITL